LILHGAASREADPATALHHDVGLLVDTVITRARETFRPGETVPERWDWARGVK